MIGYTDNSSDKKTDNPIQSIAYMLVLILTAPLRLLSEIAKKSIILGEYCEKFLIGVIIMSTGILVFESVYSLTISKRLYLTNGSVPIVSLLISLFLNILIFLLFNKFRYDIDLDKLDDLDKDKTFETIESIHDDNLEPDSYSRNEIVDDYDCADKSLCNKIDDGDIVIDDPDILKLINTTPKKDIDDVYKFDIDERVNVMNRELKMKMNGRCNTEVYENEGKSITGEDSLKDLAKRIGFDEEEFLNNEIELNPTEENDLVNHVHEQLTGHTPKGDDLLSRLVAEDFTSEDFEEEY